MLKIRNFLGPAVLMLAFVQLFVLIAPAVALYEDQIGKFDWKLTQIGSIRHAAFHGASGERIIVATEHNVLAALHTKTGDLSWRKLLEKNARGSVHSLFVVGNSVAGAGRIPEHDDEVATVDDSDLVITVSGRAPAMVRGWHAQTGHAEFEWSLTPSTATGSDTEGEDAQIDAEAASLAHFWVHDQGILFHVVPVWGSHLEVTAYAARTGLPVKSTTTRIATPWIRSDRCTLTQRMYACVGNRNGGDATGQQQQQLIAVDLTTERNELVTRALRSATAGDWVVTTLAGSVDSVRVNGDVYDLRQENALLGAKIQPDSVSTFVVGGGVLLQAAVQDNSLRLVASQLPAGQPLPELDAQLELQPHSRGIRILGALCKQTKPSGGSSATAPTCRILLTTAEGTVLLVQQARIKWTREESLADIVAVEMVDLQLSDAEGSIESELKNKDGDVIGALGRRLAGQVTHLRNTVLAVLGLGALPSATQQAGLVRDAFGLHKMLVILTASGKLFGIDNQSGAVHWVRILPDFVAPGGEAPMQILVQRTGGHFPLTARCTVLARHRHTGNGLLYQFNPISGLPTAGDGIVRLPYAVRQVMLAAQVRAGDFVRPLVLLDRNNEAHVWPADAAALADGLYMYAAEAATGVISGFQLRLAKATPATAAGRSLVTRQVWEVNVGGAGGAQRIVRLASKNRIEHVHSQGRVFNDRSVLYKYINPNLVAVATIGPDVVHKTILNVHLLDVVSGAIVYSMSHRRVRQPLHLVHSENWLVYSYYNEKVRRTEVTTVELYEGKTQANGTVWSSLQAPQLPLVERQSYVLPANVVAMRETITERGITNKHVLIALSTGSVIEMPWALLDPRRPILLPNQPREEGIIPYIPELQLPSENVINYNQSVANVRGLAAAPSGLESTCLVMAYGLDIFVTRVAPSKTFDLLKEDFDYMLIMLVLIGLSGASIVVRHLSARKVIKQAWK